MVERGLVALLCLSFWCHDVVIVLWLFLVVPWIGQQCVIVVFSDHAHFFCYHVVYCHGSGYLIHF